jgi:hypothetical protein
MDAKEIPAVETPNLMDLFRAEPIGMLVITVVK